MKSALLSGLGALSVLSVAFSLPFSTAARGEEQNGISSPLLSRCAGKFGTELRAGDQAFPLFGLDGVPWLKVESTDQTLDGAHIVKTVTGIGVQSRRRGQVVGLRFTCLIDDRGEAVSFKWNDLLPERNEALPPAFVLRGTTYYEPRIQLPAGTELRVQLFDRAVDPPELLTEEVVRSSWVEPIPYGLRLPPDIKLQGRKLVIDARLSEGSATLYRLKQPQLLTLDQLQQPIDLTMIQNVPSTVQ
jgi:uncharacterized lipoprotein YbaY